MSEHMRSIWTLSTPLSEEYNLAMQSLTEMEYTKSIQHKPVTKSRIERDRKGLSQLLNKVQSLDTLSAERVPRSSTYVQVLKQITASTFMSSKRLAR